MMNRVRVKNLDSTNHKPRDTHGLEGHPQVLPAEGRESVGEVREEHGSGGRGGGVKDGERFEVDDVVYDKAVRNTPRAAGWIEVGAMVEKGCKMDFMINFWSALEDATGRSWRGRR